MLYGVKRFAMRFYPYIWSVVVLLSGYVSMLLWWKLGTNHNEPGFFHYKAATYGDSIGLTLIVFASAMYCRLACKKIVGKRTKSYVKWVPIVLAFITGVLFFAWQIEWLINAEPNWTLIKRSEPVTVIGLRMSNKFTGAGYWHAAFFVGVSTLISFFLTKAFCIRSLLADDERRRGGLCLMLGLLSFSGCFYIEMIANDNIGGDVWRLLPGVCSGALLFLAMIVLSLPARGKRVKRLKELVSILIGGLVALLVGFVILL